MCNLSFLADDLQVRFFEDQKILSVIFELAFNSNCDTSLEEALKTLANVCFQNKEFTRQIAKRCCIGDWSALFFKIPLTQTSRHILVILRFYIKVASEYPKSLQLSRSDLQSLMQVLFHAVRGFQNDEEVWTTVIHTLTDCLKIYPNLVELIQETQLLQVLTNGYAKLKDPTILGQLVKLLGQLVVFEPFKVFIVVQNIISKILAFLLNSQALHAPSDSVASHFYFFANFLSCPHEANIELLQNSLYLKLVRSYLQDSQHRNIVLQVLYNVKLIFASLSLPRMQTIKLIQALFGRLANETSDLKIIEEGLQCLAIFIQKGQEELQPKRMNDLIELDLMEVLETIEKRRNTKLEILVQTFYENFIGSVEVRLEGGGEEKIDL